jgi:hypothetical protein
MHRRCVSREGYIDAGITVCEKWRDFAMFLSDMGEKPSPDYSIERKDNTRGYSPDNCAWATDVEQANNKSTNVFVVVNGEMMTVAQFSRKYGVPYGKALRRHHSSGDLSSLITSSEVNCG